MSFKTTLLATLPALALAQRQTGASTTKGSDPGIASITVKVPSNMSPFTAHILHSANSAYTFTLDAATEAGDLTYTDGPGSSLAWQTTISTDVAGGATATANVACQVQSNSQLAGCRGEVATGQAFPSEAKDWLNGFVKDVNEMMKKQNGMGQVVEIPAIPAPKSTSASTTSAAKSTADVAKAPPAPVAQPTPNNLTTTSRSPSSSSIPKATTGTGIDAGTALGAPWILAGTALAGLGLLFAL